MRRKVLFILFPILLFLLAATPLQTVRVGIYDNPPLSIVDAETPSGLVVDVLEQIAEAEGWQLEYYPCEWEACLQALERGEIDLLGPIAYSEERSKRFDFSAETLLTNWGQVYVQSGETNISILGFAEKPVGFLADNTWLWWVLGGLTFVAALLFGIIYYLRAEVQKRTEEVQNSREELALIMDRVPEMISFLDADLRYIYADESYARWYGFTKEEVVGKYVRDILPPENYKKVHPRLLEVVETGKEVHYSHEIERIDGSKAAVAISYIPKKDQQGNVEAFFATVRDITDEKQAEIALAESESQYRHLVDNSLIGIFIVQDEHIVFVNQAMVNLFGYANTDEMYEIDMDNLIAPKDQRLVQQERLAKENDEKQKSQYTAKALRKDGSVFDAEVVSRSIEYRGRFAIQGMFIDISDRVKAEERFRRLSEASYEALFISEKGICIEQNTTAKQMFGYTNEEAIGRISTDWIAQEDRQLVMHHMLSGYEEPYRVTALRKDGTTFPAEIVGRMMAYEGRKVRVTALRDISAQIEAEESLRESEERYRTMIQKNHAVMFLIDPETGKIVEANAAASKFYGWTQEELQQKTISEINTLTDGEVAEEMEKAKTAAQNHFFFRHRLANGDIRDVEVFSTPLSVDGRQLLHSIVNDVSDRIKAEQALVESKERFEKIIAKAPIPMVVIENENEWETYNESFTKIFGYTSEDLVDWWEMVYPDEAYRTKVKKAWDEAVAEAKKTSKQIDTQTWEIRRKDGAVRTVEFDMVPLADLSVVVMTDITERLQASRALQDRERRLREAQEIGKMGHWTLDPQTYALVWSDQVYRIFNMEPEGGSITYEAFLEAVHPDDREYVRESYVSSVERQTPCDIEHRLLLNNGEIRHVHERCKTEYDQHGTPLRSIGTVQDITEEVRAELVMNVRAELAEYSLDHSLSEFLRKTLDETEKLTNSRIGFYHFVDDNQKDISLQQWSTRTVDSYCKVPDLLNLDRHYPVEQAGVWVECIATKEPAIHNDYASMENLKGLPEGHAALVRELVVPVIRGDNVVAILGVGNKSTAYTQQDVEIVSQVADVCWEIAKKKLAEEALTESQSLLREMQEVARLGSYRFYIQSATWTSDSVLDEIFGIDESYERSTEGWLGLIHPEDQPMMQEYLYQEVLGKQGTFNKRYRIVRYSTGETRWVHGLGKLEYDNQGDLLLLVGTIQDVTARAIAEEELAASEQRLRTLINSTPDIICFKDGEGRWLTANDAHLELFELTDVDYVGKTDIELAENGEFHRETFLSCKNTDELAWRAGTLSRGNEIIPTQENGDKVYDVLKVPLFKNDGTREALVVLGRDITQQIEIQNALQQHTRQMEIVNAISTAISTSLELDALLTTILQQVVQVVPCDSAAIFFVEDDQKLRIVNAIGQAENFISQSYDLEETFMNKLGKEDKVLIMDDAAADPEYKDGDGYFTIHGWMGVPLYARGNLVGYLTFDSVQPGAFTASDASLATAFATQVAQALYNAQLHEHLIADANDLEKHVQKRTEELQRFVDLTAGREIRMIELKEIIRELRRQLVHLGQVPVMGENVDIE